MLTTRARPFIYAIDPTFLNVYVPMHPIRWRSTRLPSFNLFSIRGIDRVERGQDPIKMRYNYLTNKWTGTQGKVTIDHSIDPQRAERLAGHVGTLEVLDWLTDLAAGLKALDAPSCALRISIVRPDGPQDKELRFTLKFAPAATANGKVTAYYGKFEGLPDVFLLSPESYNQIVAPIFKR